IFADNHEKEAFIRLSQDRFLEFDFGALTLGEWKERIFVPDKTLLPADKSALLLYESLGPNLRRELGLSSWFDFSEQARDFFRFFADLARYEIAEPLDCRQWQANTIGHFYEMKEAFDRALSEKSSVPAQWLEREAFFDETFAGVWDRLIFVDIDRLPPLYVRLIREKIKGPEIAFAIQTAPSDYDEEKLAIKEIHFPEALRQKAENLCLMDCENPDKQLFTLIDALSGENPRETRVFSPDPENCRYDRIFPDFFAGPVSKPMEKTNLFRFLQILYDIADAVENPEAAPDRFRYRLKAFVAAFDAAVFRDWFGFSAADKDAFYRELIGASYQYLSTDILEDLEAARPEGSEGRKPLAAFRGKLADVLEMVKNLAICGNMSDFLLFFKDILYGNKSAVEAGEAAETPAGYFFWEGDNLGMFEKIQGFLRELFLLGPALGRVIGESENKGKFLLRYVLENVKNMEFYGPKAEAELVPVLDAENARFAFAADPDVSGGKIRKGIFLDVTNRFYPAIPKESGIFTESQLRTYGMPTGEDLRNSARKKFLQNISAFDEVTLLTWEDPGEKVEFSPFMEELRLLLNRESMDKTPVTDEIRLEFLREIWAKGDPGESGRIRKSDLTLKFNPLYLPEGKPLNLAPYDYANKFAPCRLLYYFDKLMNLGEESWTVEIELLSAKYMGVFFHKGMENILNMTKANMEKGNFDLSEAEVKSVFLEILEEDCGKRIPDAFAEYYRDIVIPKFQKTIPEFYQNSLKQLLGGKKIKKISVEYSVPPGNIIAQKEQYSAQYSGKVDLVIECADGSAMIIDHKTGKKTRGQLEFYSIALYRDVNKAQKYVFNSWDGDVEEIATVGKNGKPLATAVLKETIEESMEEFLLAPVIEPAEANKNGVYQTCVGCAYGKICGRE
ncbi:MAG: PD-(D/E)XK nuclease family protein, partial [Fusobacteriaceae bacterium]|nr:PD-(D/E)XK nuclease family protein [Fusobacteriaceae bacterium]